MVWYAYGKAESSKNLIHLRNSRQRNDSNVSKKNEKTLEKAMGDDRWCCDVILKNIVGRRRLFSCWPMDDGGGFSKSAVWDCPKCDRQRTTTSLVAPLST